MRLRAARRKPSRWCVLGSDSAGEARRGLLADGHGIPVVAIRAGHVSDGNAPAAAFFVNLHVGMAASELFDESCQEKFVSLLQRAGSAATMELLVKQAAGPAVAARFLLQEGPGEQLLIAGARGLGHTEEMEAKLMAANGELANLTRELSRQMSELAAAKEEMRKFAELRELFISALAHDLKSPLSVILLSVAVLRGKLPSTQAVELAPHLNRAERSANRMLSLLTVFSWRRASTPRKVRAVRIANRSTSSCSSTTLHARSPMTYPWSRRRLASRSW